MSSKKSFSLFLLDRVDELNITADDIVRMTGHEEETVAVKAGKEEQATGVLVGSSSSMPSTNNNRGPTRGLDSTLSSLLSLSPAFSAADVPPQCIRQNSKEDGDNDGDDNTEEETISLDFDDENDEFEDDDVAALHEKCVRFNLWQNEFYDDTLRCVEECHETWFSSEDYDAFKQEIRDIVWAVTAQEKFLQQQQQEDDGSGNPCASTFSARLQSLLEAASAVDYLEPDASTLAHQMHDKLASLYRTTPDNDDADWCDLVGLESYLCTFLKRESRTRRYTLQKIVYEIQEERDEKGLWTLSGSQVELQECCCAISQDLVLFGQLLAKARLLEVV